MSKRQMSSWNNDEDLALVEIALRYIRTDKKMNDAWQEAGRILGRTAGACQNRWSTVLSKKYDASIEQARLQRNLYKEKENGGEEMSPEIRLPQNRPINSVSDAMEKAFKETKEKRVGKMNMPTVPTLVEAPATPVPKQEEPPVTEGIQQEINFEKNEIIDAKEEKTLDNPFVRIRKFVSKMEREYGDMTTENIQLKKDVIFLKQQLQHREDTIINMESELTSTREQLNEAQKQLDSYSEIKELIKQFNALD